MENLRLKNIISEIKNSVDGFNSGLDTEEQRINEFEDRSRKKYPD